MAREILYHAGFSELPRGVPSQPRVTRVPPGLQRGDRIWFTTGRCTHTIGSMILAGPPERVDLRPTLSGGYSLKRVSHRLPAQRGSRQPDQRPITLAEGAEALWSAGSFAHVVSHDEHLQIVSNRHDGGKRTGRTWKPWDGPDDPRLHALTSAVETGSTKAVDGWFRRKENLPLPSYFTKASTLASKRTELDHLIPVRVLRDRLVAGTIDVADIPKLLLVVECTHDEHPKEDARLPDFNIDVLHVCSRRSMPKIALLRYSVPLYRTSDRRRVPSSEISDARRLWLSSYGVARRRPTRPTSRK